jgi:hypothetical protein
MPACFALSIFHYEVLRVFEVLRVYRTKCFRAAVTAIFFRTAAIDLGFYAVYIYIYIYIYIYANDHIEYDFICTQEN